MDEISIPLFVDRAEELAFLEEQWKREKASFVVVYGRRRIGKTALVSHFLSKRQGLYFLATEESEAQNRTAFRELAAEFSGNELLASSNTADWDLVFKALFEPVPGKNKHERLVIVIDEFQYLAKANPAFPSILQKVWDSFLSGKNVMLILCGSSVSMMESSVLSYNSPLYGRRTGQIRLEQIPFSYYGTFFPGKGERELVERYAVTGGVPKYIEFFESGNLNRAIQKNILTTSGFLCNEPAFLLRMEVSEIGSYYSLIKVIAAGNHKLSQIAAALELKQSGISKYLNTLITLGILEREVPVTEENPDKSKRGLYRIKDNFLQFWFRFVFPRMGYIELGRSGEVLEQIKQNFIDGHVSYVWEDICREKMWMLNFKKRWGFSINRCGRWWNKGIEIDIVAYDSSGLDMIFGECKFSSRKTGAAVLRELEQKAETVPWKKENRRNHFVIFSIGGFTDELKAAAKSRKDLLLV
ncbi:MAG: ATP-binding protein [Treponema sp.]|jgi:AAA+ ATPase superfamily predicted ATPase|nr:ATP-binding protein [Treponema sp.]